MFTFFLNGILFAVLVFVFLYLIGLVNNLWSHEIIHPSSIKEILTRSIDNLVKLIGAIIILILISAAGTVFFHLFTIF
jgi:hypothetical protein